MCICLLGCVVTGKTSGGGVAPEAKSSQVVLVYFLGGCTYTEIAALRFLGRLRGASYAHATCHNLNVTCHYFTALITYSNALFWHYN